MYLGLYAFIGGVVVLGAGIGFWLQAKLNATNQNISLPSAFNAKEYLPVIKSSSSSPAH